jgi:MFS family permease
MTDARAARSRLFFASCLALVVTAMSFAIRGDIMDQLGTQFALSKEQVGTIAGTAFWGFTLSIVIGGPLCDALGMGRLLRLACLCHLAGIATTIGAGFMPPTVEQLAKHEPTAAFWMLFVGTLLIGLANGCIEAACNPLIATLYADNKAQKLNHFHVWFPGGIVIGGVLSYLVGQWLAAGNVLANTPAHAWQVKMALMVVPAILYGALFKGVQFPPTERVASGTSGGQMIAACFRPLFVLMLLCMLMTAATELGPNQWIPDILTSTAGVSGILVLVWINGLMAIDRQFAGPVVHKLSPTGMLLMSSVLGAIGLYSLSVANSDIAVFAAATVFALGICYFWPTMLGFVAERVPRSGALGLALMGGAGMLSVSAVLPIMGGIYDEKIAAAKQSGLAEAAAKAAGGAATLQDVVVLPIALAVVFTLLYLGDRRAGGYRAEKLAAAGATAD